jgi:acyl-[acyl-carrier-protein]-phospholipid O-acyltransferase / long-chain-fatty-acid--[acyl-carrier-protein] ligase
MDFSLLKIKSFLPYILIVFINVVVDTAHKITIQNTVIKAYDGDTLVILSAIVNALMLIPFVLLFSPSGFISDKYSKALVIRYASFVAIVITALITISYILGLWYLAFGLTIVLAIQAAIYSPAKYGIIKEIVGEENLGEANGFIQAVTITAILLSGLFFSVLFEMFYSSTLSPNETISYMVPIGIIMVILSTVEFILSFKLSVNKKVLNKVHFSISKYTNLVYLKQNVKIIFENKSILRSIIGLSFFWGIGQLLVSIIPAHYKEITNSSNAVAIQSIMALSAAGVMIGSFIAGKASKKRIELGIVPLGAIGIFISLLAFAFANSAFWLGVASFGFGFFGGLFIVPLNALIQFLSPQKSLGTILAGNNFIQNISMIGFLFLSIIIIWLGMSSSIILFIVAILAFFVGLFVIKQIPHLFARIMLLPILKTRYKFALHGLENLPSRGGVLMLGNHISWIDWLILQSATPRPIKFVMEKTYYQKWYMKRFLNFFQVIPISAGGSKKALDGIRERLDNGEVVALFPEGRISFNGQMNEFKKGFELAISGTKHKIVPFYIHGLWGSTFSKANSYFKSMAREGDKRDVRVAFGEPLESDANIFMVKQAVVALSREVWQESMMQEESLMDSWLRWAKARPLKRSIVDSLGSDLNNLKVMTGVFLFSKIFRKYNEKNVGVLLPSSAIGSIVNLALFIIGKRPVNLNYTLSPHIMLMALDQGEISHIITSEKFLEKLEGKGFNFRDVMGERIVTLEQVSGSIKKSQKTKILLEALVTPKWWLKFRYFDYISMEDTATILFSSGSEGHPKGIELTHRNLIANIKQVAALFQYGENDVMLNSLPIFHSFGLTVTTLLPLCEGVPMASVADPTDSVAIGKMVARYNATILFATPTFLRLYTLNKKLDPLMFASLRMVVAGAEKLKPEIRKAFKEKFGIGLLEGYGATETSPVVSCNMPNALDLDTMQVIVCNKEGTIGQPIPGTLIKIVDPDSLQCLGLNEDGLILVGGAQVMKGYFNDPEKTKEAIVEIDGVRYYKTGDKGHIDEDGFLSIVDRYSRFAKIGGEMISLGQVEMLIDRIFGDELTSVVVAIEDEKKGEQTVLLHNSQLSPQEIQKRIKESSLIPLMQPSFHFYVEDFPKLASGKTDFKKAKEITLEKMLSSKGE